MGVDLKVVHVRVFIAKASRGPASDPAKVSQKLDIMNHHKNTI